MKGLLRIASTEQHFSDPWVGSPRLNGAGLHLGRVMGSAAVANLRVSLARVRWPMAGDARDRLREARATLARVGVLVLERFLEDSSAERLRRELLERFADADARVPPVACAGAGYGPRRPFDGGFDRCDGSTENRFLVLDRVTTPESARFAENAALRALLVGLVGARPKLGRFFAYRNRLGDPASGHDPQMDLHRDTFQPAFKLWYFVDAVEPADGPFEYVVGSHRLDRARLAWEQRRALAASRPLATDTGGSFRIDTRELASLSLPPPSSYPVAANTLVLANVFGFHRRGRGLAGRSRMSIHASLRPQPFDPRPR